MVNWTINAGDLLITGTITGLGFVVRRGVVLLRYHLRHVDALDHRLTEAERVVDQHSDVIETLGAPPLPRLRRDPRTWSA